jgi:hypothetical protein
MPSQIGDLQRDLDLHVPIEDVRGNVAQELDLIGAAIGCRCQPLQVLEIRGERYVSGGFPDRSLRKGVGAIAVIQ